MTGVRIDQTRKRPKEYVDLVSPHGTEITVDALRAETLLARQPVQRADETWARYVHAGENPVIDPKEANAAIAASLKKQSEAE